jgi:hypothetical protein
LGSAVSDASRRSHMSSTGSEMLRTVDVATARHQAHIEEAEKLAADYENRSANIETRLRVLTWMVGINTIISLGVLWRLLG